MIDSLNANLDDYPWLHWLESCPSTNTWAIEHASRLQHGDVVFTRQQTAGRGQHNRVWYAPAGVLTASFVLDRLPVAQLSGLSLAVGLAVIYAVEDLVPDLEGQLQLKWSNDVLLQARKLAGILCEAASSSRAEQVRVVVGIGLNRCADFTEVGIDRLSQAISLHQVTDRVPSELALLKKLRHYLMQTSAIMARSGLAAFLPELRRRDWLIDRVMEFDFNGQRIAGQGAGIDAQGRLLLQVQNASGAIEVQAFSSGRVVNWSLNDRQN